MILRLIFNNPLMRDLRRMRRTRKARRMRRAVQAELCRWIDQRSREAECEIEKLTLTNEGTSSEAQKYRCEIALMLKLRNLMDEGGFDNDDLVKKPYDDCPGCA